MKLTELRKVIREEVKAAIQEELKDILLEAVRSPKPAITENLSVAATPQTTPDPQAQKAFREQMLAQMSAAGGDLNLSTNDTGTFRPSGPTSGEGSALGAGDLGLDQIMGIMNSK